MIVLTVPGASPAEETVTQLRLLALRFPGREPLTLVAGDRRLVLGREWRYDASRACLAAMQEFGDAVVDPSLRAQGPGHPLRAFNHRPAEEG